MISLYIECFSLELCCECAEGHIAVLRFLLVASNHGSTILLSLSLSLSLSRSLARSLFKVVFCTSFLTPGLCDAKFCDRFFWGIFSCSLCHGYIHICLSRCPLSVPAWRRHFGLSPSFWLGDWFWRMELFTCDDEWCFAPDVNVAVD